MDDMRKDGTMKSDRLISLNAALNLIDANNGILYDSPTLVASLKRMVMELPSAQQKKLKYSGDSICVRCQTKDCDGCLFEPMEGVMNG